MLRIILFGENGQLGKQFINDLDKSYELIVFSKEEIDFKNINIFRTKIQKIKPTYIINAAAYTAVDLAEQNKEEAFMINALALKTLASICKMINATLVHFSTDYVFDGKKSIAYTEDDITAPLNIYGKSKLEGEKNIINSGCNFIIIRVSWLMSKYNNNFIKNIINKLIKGEHLKVVDDQIGVPTSTNFVVNITKKLLVKNVKYIKEIFHVVPNGSVSWYNLALYLVDEMKRHRICIKKNQVQSIKSSQYKTPAERPKNSCLNNEKVSSFLNLDIKSWKIELKDVIDFHIKNI